MTLSEATPPVPGAPSPPEVRAQLVRELLSRSRGVLLARLDVLDTAALHLLVSGPLEPGAHAEAARTAHQLLSLGTFGLERGSRLARRADDLLAGGPGEDPDAAAVLGAELAELALQLRDEVLQAAPAASSAPVVAAAAPALPAPRPAAELPAPAAVAGSDVLLVEDDPLLVELLQRALEGQGYRVAQAGDGPAAIAALDVPAGRRPGLVLLDIDLPALDGFGVLRALADRGLLPGVQVLVLTARASEPDVLAALQLGAADHVAKPFSLPVLLARVARATGR